MRISDWSSDVCSSDLREGSHDPGSAIRTDAQIARDRRQRNIRDRRIENLHEGSKSKRKGRQGKDPSPQRRRAGLTHSVEPRLAAMICAIRASTAGSSPTLACLEKTAFAGLPIKVPDMSLVSTFTFTERPMRSGYLSNSRGSRDRKSTRLK